MAEKKIYQKTKVVVGGKDFDPATKKYNSEVETKFYKTLPFTLEVFEKPQVKEWDRGTGTIIWEISVANKQVGIREKTNEYGKQYAGSVIKWEFFVNLEQVLSRSETPSYEVTFVERDFNAEGISDPEEDPDKPF